MSIIDRFIDADKEPTRPRMPIEGYEKKPLVSLEEAVQKVKDLVHDFDRILWLTKRDLTTPVDGLNIDESAAIRLYTLQWSQPYESLYAQLNRTLRAELREQLTVWFSYLKIFLTALYKLPSIKKTVWRGVHGDVSEHYKKDYIWWGFSSCTETMDVLEQFIGRTGVRTIFMIECLNGKNIRNHSVYENENEILLMPGTYLRVKSKWSPADGLHMIHLEEATPPHQLIAPPGDISTVDDVLSDSLISSITTVQSSDEKIHYQLSRNQPTRLVTNDLQQYHSTCRFQTGSYETQLVKNNIVLLDKPWLDRQNQSTDHRSTKIRNQLECEIEGPPGDIDTEILTRIQGSMIGLALGDALGTPAEYRSRQYLLECPVTDLQGGGTWNLEKGQFTSQTSMALCLANSLVARRDFIPYDQLVRYKWWYKYGYMSVTGKCYDIDAATSQSLREFERHQKQFANEHGIPLERLDYISDFDLLEKFNTFCSDEGAADNGALVRLAPVPLFFWRHPIEAVEFSGISGEITHGDRTAYDACRYYGALIVAALQGESKEQLLDRDFYSKHKTWFYKSQLTPEIIKISRGSYQREGGYDSGIRGKGYIVNALEAALWAFWCDENSFEIGALHVVNLGDETGSTAAIYGQLAGAYYGYKNLPKHWLSHLYARKFIMSLSKWIAYEGQQWASAQEQ
ncbi:unnamed protein product [Adineta steineri]|uniref:NAD(P)(+)--arginine ADP-ribosyltransferase n=1 Tax=Adineta steineri TaxID=433720 RepID=A0A815T483_9BILA|nr:unnamed protein product [Adineta steineri]CAF1642981.1 unnamed protein product [Adineta steineri]